MNPLLRVLLESSIRIAGAAIVAALALKLARVRASAVRHAVWTGVLFAMLLMPALPYLVPPISAPVPAPKVVIVPASYELNSGAEFALTMNPTPEASAAAFSTASATASPAPTAGAPVRTAVWPVVVSAVWGLGALILLARFGAGWMAMWGVVRRSAAVQGFAGADVFESAEVMVPVTVGAVSPKVLLPSGWREWPEEKLRAVLAHERAHVHRRDPLVAMLARLNRCLFWFHPLAWWLEKRLALTAEHAADDAALRVSSEKRKYAEVLLDMAEIVRRRGARLAWQGVGVDNPGLLGERIERILRGGFLGEVSRARKIVVGTCCLAAVIFVAACQQRSFYTGALREDPKYAETVAKQKAAESYSKAAREMTPQQVADLEALVAKNPEDLEARKKLMIFYQYNAAQRDSDGAIRAAAPGAINESMVAAFRKQKLWFIEHHPENDLTVLMNPVSDPAGDLEAKKLWTAAVSRKDAPPAVLGHAAIFSEGYDKQLAERLYLRAKEADPNGPWASRLALLYVRVLGGPEATGPFATWIRKQLAESTDPKLLGNVAFDLTLPAGKLLDLAKSCAEQALKLDPNQAAARAALERVRLIEKQPAAPKIAWNEPIDKWPQILAGLTEAQRLGALAEAGESAYTRGEWADHKNDAATAKADLEWARKFAQQALDAGEKFKSNPEYGTAVYKANMTLGMLAMRDGNVKKASRYMVEASKAPLNNDAANDIMMFAIKLPVYVLKYGGLDGREATIEYLERLGKVIHRSDLPLAENAAQLRAGYMPIWYQYQAAQLK